MNPSVPALPSTAQCVADLDPAQWLALLAAQPAQAATWMSAAAKLGHADAQAVLGQWLLDGHGLARNPAEALHWFHSAAGQGHLMGINMSGRCHEVGWGTAVDFKQAAHWYGLAAARGLPEGLYNLANLHASGKGVAQDHARAVTLYQEAASQGYAKAHGKLGRYHEDGLVLEQNAAEARRCYERAAQGDDFRGQFNLAGLLAAEGRHAEALQWLERVVQRAPPHYLRLTGDALLQSPRADYQAVARRMLARAADNQS